MTVVPQPLTKIVGTTERTLQALLGTQLRTAQLSFPEWAVLMFLSSGSLTETALRSAIEHGAIATIEEADALIAAVAARNLVRVQDGIAELTDEGRSLFIPLRAAVQSLTVDLVAGIADADLETTNRTLSIVATRARDMLAGNSGGMHPD